MFGTIRKHQSWLWFIIIAVMVLSMIVWQNQLGKNGNGQNGSGNAGSIDGKPITEAEYKNTEVEASLEYLVRYRQWPGSPGTQEYDSQRQTYYRIFLIRTVEKYNIHADADSVGQFGALVLRQIGNGQSVPLETLLEELKPKGVTAENFQSFLQHDLDIQQLRSVVALSGKLVTPTEIQSLYEQEYQEVTADAVFFSVSNYLARIPDSTPVALAQYYTNQQAKYRLPDQMQVSYVYYNVTNFMPEAEKQHGTNLTHEVEEDLMKVGTNSLRFGKTPEEAKAKLRELVLQDTALSNAYIKALAFQEQVMTNGQLNADNLAAVAKSQGLTVMITKPFDKEYGPSEFNFGSSFPVATLFNLTAQDPFPDGPIRAQNGVYVLAYNKSIPSYIPSLEEIHTRAAADFKYMQAMRLTQANGHVFAQTATNDLAFGKTFAAICTAAKITPVEVPAFSASSETLPEEVEMHVEPNTFKQVAFSIQPGAVSDFVPTQDGGFVIHVKQRLPLDQTKMKAQLPEFSDAVRQRRESEAFELWFEREGSAALRDIPFFQAQSKSTAAR